MSRGDMFSRWSERRARVAREETEAERAVPGKPAPTPEAPEPATPEAEDALLAKLGLPRPEDVTGAEIRKFLANGVPEIFRRRALRALWRSDPTFAVLDGLNDYDEDFTLPEFNQKVVATAYEVGRGIRRQIAEVVSEEVGREEEDAAPQGAMAPPDTPVAVARPTPEPPEAEPVAESAMSQDIEDEGEGAPVFRPRRMNFDT